jgi:hypothetical protein
MFTVHFAALLIFVYLLEKHTFPSVMFCTLRLHAILYHILKWQPRCEKHVHVARLWKVTGMWTQIPCTVGVSRLCSKWHITASWVPWWTMAKKLYIKNTFLCDLTSMPPTVYKPLTQLPRPWSQAYKWTVLPWGGGFEMLPSFQFHYKESSNFFMQNWATLWRNEISPVHCRIALIWQETTDSAVVHKVFCPWTFQQVVIAGGTVTVKTAQRD